MRLDLYFIIYGQFWQFYFYWKFCFTHSNFVKYHISFHSNKHNCMIKYLHETNDGHRGTYFLEKEIIH